ncbi:hypothetical protein BGW80DRAFT_1463602 [Lactifluus volemus]|nr:hypothetical protein BGW80DRAFT_1463602 [Lactifluus volemus]
MVNWHDPAVLEKEFFAALKLNHVVAGIYIWETLCTVGFELDVLRGKRPYRRTIWLYLATRYPAFLAFIIYFIDIDSSIKLPCQFVSIASTLGSRLFLIALRVVAIWDRNIFVSSLVMGTWLGDLGLNIYGSIALRPKYDPILETCVLLGLHKVLANVIFMLVVDFNRFMAPSLPTGGSPSFLFYCVLTPFECIIWLFLAAIADVPLLVFIALNLNDAMNDFQLCSFSLLDLLSDFLTRLRAIAAGRMYRSLFEHAFPTEYVTATLSRPNPQNHDRAANIRGQIHDAQSNDRGLWRFIPTRQYSCRRQTTHWRSWNFLLPAQLYPRT